MCLKALAPALLQGATVSGEAGQKLAAQDQAAEVVVYVTPGPVRSTVDCHPRANASWIFAKAGIGIVWRDGYAKAGAAPGGVPAVQIRYVTAAPAGIRAASR